MNSTPNRKRFAAWIAGFTAVLALMFAVSATSASAAVVGNPGTFTATWSSGEMKQGNVNWPLGSLRPGGGNFTFQMNVNADGSFSVPSVAFAEVPVPGSYQSGGIGFLNQRATIENIRLEPQATGAWSGNINPASGAFNISTPMKWLMRANSSSSSGLRGGSCNINNSTTINASSATAGGSAYSISGGSGSVMAVANPITLPGSNDCSGQVTLDNASINTQTNTFFALPGSGNLMRYGLTITPAIKAPVAAKLSVNPNPVAVGAQIDFDASETEILHGLAECVDPDPSEPACGYRWDFDGDGNADAVTNEPTTSHIYATAGDFAATVTAFDVNGDSGSAQVNVAAQTRPVAQLDVTPAANTKETVNVFEFSIPDNPYSATTQCSIDGGAFTACDSGDSFTFSQAPDTAGAHQFQVRGITPGGVIGPAASYDFNIDRVLPRVTIAPGSLPADPTNVTSANFTFTADKANTTLECQLDGGSWTACGSNSTGSQAYSNLGETPNPHEFRVRATDTVGNVGDSGYDWEVDTTKPVPTFVDKPANPTNDVSPLITWSNNEPVQMVQCRLKTDGVLAPWGPCDSLTSIQYTDMEDNQYGISVAVMDLAGNWSNVVTHDWLLETVAPNLEITKGPQALSQRSLAQFFFDFEENAALTCQLDSQPVQDPCASGVKYAYLAEGSHIFSVTATDAATNATTKTYTWSVKTVQPVVSILESSVPESSSTVDTADFEFTTANGDAECRFDGGSWSACDSNSGQSYTDLPDGNHTFEVRATDTYGNVSAIDAYSWLVATASPAVEFTSTPEEKTRQSTALFEFDVTSADANVVTECSLDGLETFDCSNPAVLAGLQDGDHTFTVTATDTAGIQGVASYEWNVKAKIPGLGFDVTPVAISDSASANFEFSSDEDPDVGYECKLDGGSWDECESPVSQSSLGEGAHAFSIRATDEVGNVATETYNWTVDTVAPTVTFNSRPAASTTDIAEVIGFSASEAGATFECKLDSGSFASCASPTLLRNLASGAHTFTVRATDEAGNTGADAVANWTVGAPSTQSGASGQSSSNGVQAALPKGAVQTGKVMSTKADTAKAKAKKKAKAKAKAKTKKKAKAKAKAKAKKKALKAKKKARRAQR